MQRQVIRCNQMDGFGTGGFVLPAERGEIWGAVVSTCVQRQVIRCNQRTCSRSTKARLHAERLHITAPPIHGA